MTPAQQAELEQVAREWVAQHELVFKGDVRSLITLLAAQRATVLEEVRKKFFDNSMTDAQFAEWLCTQAQEQRP